MAASKLLSATIYNYPLGGFETKMISSREMAAAIHNGKIGGFELKSLRREMAAVIHNGRLGESEMKKLRREVTGFDKVEKKHSNRKRLQVVRATADAKETTMHQLLSALDTKDADVVKSALDEMKQSGSAKQWDSLPGISRRTTYIRELTTVGIKNAEELAIPSVRNDAAFLATVVGVTSVVAVLGSQLPGDWGFFVPYLVGSLSLVVLAVGSVAPGLLQAAIGVFSKAYPDYQERLLRHEAGHFLVAYLVGLPIVGYSIDLGKEHVNLMDEKLQERIYKGTLEAKELDKLAVVSMAGLAAEGLMYEKVEGQSADLFSLQRLINRTKPPLSNNEQQNLTRWAVLFAASLLKNNAKAFAALQKAMGEKVGVAECVAAIESA